ncbi:MAG: ATP synthase subunit I [Pseudomonadota bacterium]
MMTLPVLDADSAWAIGLLLAAYLAGGIALGALYFRLLWWIARRFGNGSHVMATIALMVGRFVLLAAVLIAVSREGAMPLLTTALGIFIARFFVTRQVRNLPESAR